MTLLFQNFFAVPSYLQSFEKSHTGDRSFEAIKRRFLENRYMASHILQPVYDDPENTFFTNGNMPLMQRAWARERGMPGKSTLSEILLAQIEEHRTEIFYNFDPFTYDGTFAARLPASVKSKIAWRAAPGKINLFGYDLVVSNFPSIRSVYDRIGYKTAEFFPAHDPILNQFAENQDRDIDILFIGGYTRHHLARNKILSRLACLAASKSVVFHLDVSKYAWLSKTPLAAFRSISNLAPPRSVAAVAHSPVFGLDMYRQLSRAKIVVNAAGEIAGASRGNMRCFEAMGAGALLLTDAGDYPEGMVDGVTMAVYNDIADLIAKAQKFLQNDDDKRRSIAQAGHEMVRNVYSRDRQLKDFLSLPVRQSAQHALC